MQMRSLRHAAVGLAMLLPSAVTSADAPDYSQALKEIIVTADQICGTVATSGQSSDLQMKGDVKAQLSGLARKLADLGISGTGDITSANYQGILQAQLAATLKDERECKLAVFTSLKDVLLPAPASPPAPEPARDPNALYQYGAPVAEGMGGILDQAHGVIKFQAIRSSGKADPTREFEYQDWVVRCPQMPTPPPNTLYGQYIGMAVGGICEIVRHR
jgi:hypothetical protein